MDSQVKQLFISYCVGKKALRPSSTNTYIAKIELFEKAVKKSLDDISQQDIIDYLAEMKLKYNKNSNTRRQARTAIQNFYEWYSGYAGIQNPATGLTKIKEIIPFPKLVHPDEIERMIYAIENKYTNDWGRRACAIISLLVDTGVRVEELENMKAGAIQVIHSSKVPHLELIVPPTKGCYERVIPFGSFMRKSISEYFGRYYIWLIVEKQQHPSQPLFFQIKNKHFKRQEDMTVPLLRGGIQHILNRASHEAGIDRLITPHQFRHTFATYYIYNKMRKGKAYNLITLSKLMGHKDIKTTMSYVHIADRLTGEILKDGASSTINAQDHMEGYMDILRELTIRTSPNR